MQIECGIQVITDNLLHIMRSDFRAKPQLYREHDKQTTHTTSTTTMMMRSRGWTQKDQHIVDPLAQQLCWTCLEGSSSGPRQVVERPSIEEQTGLTVIQYETTHASMLRSFHGVCSCRTDQLQEYNNTSGNTESQPSKRTHQAMQSANTISEYRTSKASIPRHEKHIRLRVCLISLV